MLYVLAVVLTAVTSANATPMGPTTAPRGIAFAFSTLAFQEDHFGGDGAWALAIEKDEQTAIDQSKVGCIQRSAVPNWCGAGNGGHWVTCPPTVNFIAFAVNNDGVPLHWSYGYAIGEATLGQARADAMAKCGKPGCRLWSGQVDCSVDAAPYVTGGPGVPLPPGAMGSHTLDVTAGGSDQLFSHTDLVATLVDASGNPSGNGRYIQVSRPPQETSLLASVTESFQPAGGVLVEMLPGQTRRAPVNAMNGHVSVLFNVWWN